MLKLRSLVTVGALALAMLSTNAYANFFSISDWHNTRDGFGGLKQSRYNPDVYYAIGNDTVFYKNAVYEMLPGYRLLTVSEHQALTQSYNGPSLPFQYHYYNQGGWSGYVFEGGLRTIFTYADSNVAGYYTHAGIQDSVVGNYQNGTLRSDQANPTVTSWAGFMLLKDDSLLPRDVSSPATLGVLGALLLLCAGVRARRQV